MKNPLKRIKTNTVISALLYTLLGLALLLRPELSTNVLCTVLGVVLVVCGVTDILDFVFHRDGTLYYALRLIAGIILAAVGAWLITQPTLIAVVIPRIIGVLICFHGVRNLSDALTLRKKGSTNALSAAFMGAVTVLCGLVLVLNPFQSYTTVLRLIGISLIYDGISDIWITAEVSKAVKLAEKELTGNVVDVDYQDVSENEFTKDFTKDDTPQ